MKNQSIIIEMTIDDLKDYKKQVFKEFAENVKEKLVEGRIANDNVVIIAGVMLNEILKEERNQ